MRERQKEGGARMSWQVAGGRVNGLGWLDVYKNDRPYLGIDEAFDRTYQYEFQNVHRELITYLSC